MEGFLWLLLQTLPLLTASAVVFFILGWRWRGQEPQKDGPGQIEKIVTDSATTEPLRQERDAARATEEKVRLLLVQTQTEQQEAQDRQTQLQKEILRLSDELKLARQNSVAVIESSALAVEKTALEAEKQSLIVEKESLLKLRQELEASQPAHAETPLKPAKTRVTKSVGKVKKPRSSTKKSES